MMIFALWVCASLFTSGDATSAWDRAGRPTNGIQEAEDWVLSCISQPIDPESLQFAGVEIEACKQQAIEALITHYVGARFIPESIPAQMRPLVDTAVAGWLVDQVRLGGATWVRAGRGDTADCVVLAVPREVCMTLPRGEGWTRSLPNLAAAAEGWVVPAALLEAADEASGETVARIVLDRLAASIEPVTDRWPSGFIEVPEGISPAALGEVSLESLSAIAAMRPGDAFLWEELAIRCEADRMTLAARIVRQLPKHMGWPLPSPDAVGKTWADVPTEELPESLTFVVRAGGGIPARSSDPGVASREATAAFFSKEPDPLLAESKAREASVLPDPDALNLLAALRLLDPLATDDAIRHALAFAWQAQTLSPDHPYARVNVLRAMHRLGMRDEARQFLKTVRAPKAGTWAAREIDVISRWLCPVETGAESGQ